MARCAQKGPRDRSYSPFTIEGLRGSYRPRLDYSAGVTGGVPMAHYAFAYREFDGIRFPTQRRAFRRNAEGSAITSAVSVAIDISEVRLSGLVSPLWRTQ